MKKISFNAVAVAVGALFASSAFASIDLDAATPAPTKFASELNYSDSGNPITAGATTTAITTKLGFGVSNTQTRFIRVDLDNGARFNAAAAPANVTGLGASATTVAAGGAVDDDFVIYQFTADANYLAGQSVTITLPAIEVTNSNSAALGVTYRLYETGTAAQSESTALYSKTGQIAVFAAGLNFKLTPGTSTALVSEDFKKFAAGAVVTKELGKFTYAPTAGVVNNTGAAVSLANLITTARIVFRGDLSAAATLTTGLAAGTAACGGATNLTLDSAESFANFTVDTNTHTDAVLCYLVDGTTQINAGNVTAELDMLTKPASSSVADIAAATVGTIARDGTELIAPWFTIFTGYQSRFVLNSTYSKDAPYTAKVITEDGNTCTTGTGVSGTVKAGKQLQVSAASICSTLTAGQRASVVFTVAAPNNTISGTYVVTAPNGTNSFDTMIRPAH